MTCPNYYPLVSSTESASINPCFTAVLFHVVSILSAITSVIYLYQIKFKVGSYHKQSFSYKLRIGFLLLYDVAVLSYLAFVNDRFFFYAIAGNAAVNIILLLPLLVREVLYSIVPHGAILFASLFQMLLFISLAIQDAFGGDMPLEGTYWSRAAEIIIAFSSGALFVLEFGYYKPSVQLTEYYLSNGMPTNVPNIISMFTFTYMNEMISKNYNNPNFNNKDLEKVLPSLLSENNYRLVNTEWQRQAKFGRKSLFFASLKSIGPVLALSLMLNLSGVAFTFAQPQLFRILIQWIGDPAKTLTAKLCICFSLFLCSILQTILHNFAIITASIGGNTLRAALMRMIYNKAVRLSPEAKKNKTTGTVISLITVDTQLIFNIFADSAITIFVYPTEISICLVSLYYLLGNAMWAGLAMMVIALPINSFLIEKMKLNQQRFLKHKDARTSQVSDIFSSIKSVKLYSWETPLLEKLEKVRNNLEIGTLKKKNTWRAISGLVTQMVPYAICCASFYFYSRFNSVPLTAEIIFPSIALFNLLTQPLQWLPDSVSDMFDLAISMKRIGDFLLLEELEQRTGEDCSGELVVSNADFLWSKAEYTVALKNINYTVSKGQLSCIVGRVGSGKTAFLKALLGELPMVTHDATKPPVLYINGSVAYCSQVPWIMNSSVKQNILFNHDFDEDYYNLVLDACDLMRDIATLEDKDETLVGEKGISLSGGQKARLSLARALYARADIYILDDILSAVDSHVSAKLIARVFSKNGGLLANKTTILATNNVRALNSADEIILLEDKSILEKGSFEQVLKDGNKLSELIKNFGNTATDPEEIEKYMSVETHVKTPEARLEEKDDEVLLSRLTFDNNAVGTKRYEKSEFGKVNWGVYLAYAKACGTGSIIIMFVLMIVKPLVVFGDSYWLKIWSDANEKAGFNTSFNYYIGVYLLIAIGISVLTCVHDYSLKCVCAMNASRTLHYNLVLSLLRAPMAFFESVPLGRILNRFTNDIANVDVELERTFEHFSGAVVNIIVIIIVITFNLPAFLVIFSLLAIVYIYYLRYYVGLSREIKRLLSISRSPVISQIGETIAGADTITAYSQVSVFDHFVALLIDNNIRTIYNNFSLARWISIRLEIIGAVVILAVSILAVITELSSQPLGSAMVGLVLSYSLTITESLNVAVRTAAFMESEIVSVERILEYSQVKSEAPLVVPEHRTPKCWPSKGAIEFKDYSTSYRADLAPVLKNLNFKITSLEKIGVVGRTGAGKSTLAQSLFRLLEPTHGKIEIDGVVINDIGLFDLRHNLNIIPQDSQAFQGTVRSNIDPLAAFSDKQLLRALELSHFQKFMPGIEILDYPVSEHGSNLSVGQRQLLCLARSLLNPSNILVLDEATAAVDVETDKIIQETIRSEFNDRTIITIAHRLDTIMDYDKVLVLDEGEVKEFDKIDVLLQNKDSLFYKLCEKGGYI